MANAVSIITGTVEQLFSGEPNVFDTISVAQYLSKVAQGSEKDARLLPQQTFEGRQVYVVEVSLDGNAGKQTITAYFDTQSYVLRKATFHDGRQNGGSEERRPKTK